MAGAWIRFTDASRSQIEDDLSSWELINGSDDEEMVDYSYDDEEEVDIFVLESPSSDSDPNLSAESSAQDLIDQARVIEDLVRHDLVKQVAIVEHCDYNQYDHYRDADEYEDGEEEEEDDEDEGYDLDDELVPRSVTDRFERQRMRKLGKRAYPKMSKSKRLPYSFNRPGCVHGKHGLGLKHNISL